MDDYKKTLKRILTPSLFLFLQAAASSDLGFALSTERSCVNICAGDITQALFAPGFTPGVFLFTSAVIILPFIYSVSIKTGSARETSGKLLMLILISLIINTIIIMSIKKRYEDSLPLTSPENSLITVMGKIIKIKEMRYGSGIILRFRITKRPDGRDEENRVSRGYLYLEERGEAKEGDTLTMNCRMKKIQPDRDQSSYTKKLFRQGILSILRPLPDTVKITKPGNNKTISSVRKGLRERIDLLFPGKTSALVKALILGERKYINGETTRKFIRAGVLHVLAASGLHVGILAAIPMLLLGLLRIRKMIIISVTLALLTGYLTLTGMPVSLLRAYLMFALSALIFLSGLEKNMLNIVFLTATAVLVSAPEELYTPGFQLSFGATAGILIFYKTFREIFSFIPGFIGASVSVTLSAQAFVMPLTAFHMGNINFTGILSNIVVIPAVSLLMIISLASGFVSLFKLDAGIVLGRAADFIYSGILNVIETLSRLNGHFNTDPLMTIPLLTCILLALLIFPLVRKKNILAFPLLLCITAVWFTLYQANGEKRKKFTLFESQGERALLINSNKTRFLIGKIPEMKTARAVIRRIEELNMDKINLVITDPDFYNALTYSYIIKRTEIGRCIISPQFKFSEPVKRLFTLSEKKKLKLEFADIKTDLQLIESHNEAGDETGYAGALAAYKRLTIENQLKKDDKIPGGEIMVVNPD